MNAVDPWGLKLTSGQSAAVAVASSAAAFTASLIGSPAAGAAAGALVGALGTLVAEASDGDFDLSWKDLLNNTASGAIGGYAGGVLGELGKAAEGIRAGWGMMGALGGFAIDAALYGSDPLLGNPCE